eukprot:1851011-Amphidinium_carterae.1
MASRMEITPPTEWQKQGVREIKRQMRAIRTLSKEELGAGMPDNHLALAWMPSFAADVINRYGLGKESFKAVAEDWPEMA